MTTRLGRIASLLLVGVGALAGCADTARNVYEGKRTSDTILQTPMERATQPIRSHEDYERERSKTATEKY